jgi:HAD superfamily hydrolase (TIGR01549 family)
MKYSAVLFDLDGTLRANLPEKIEAFVAYAGRAGLALDAGQVATCERQAHRYWSSADVDADMARFDKRGFWVNYNEVLLRSMRVAPTRALAEAIEDMFVDHDPVDVVYADARPVITALRNMGITVGLVTNRDHDVSELLESYGLLELFHFTLTAAQAGSFKPEPGIFQKALALAGGVDPSKALYIGDNYYADIVGARNIGMDAVLLDPRRIFIDLDVPMRIRHLREVLSFVDTDTIETT